MPSFSGSILKAGVEALAGINEAFQKAGITPPYGWPARKAWLRFDTALRDNVFDRVMQRRIVTAQGTEFQRSVSSKDEVNLTVLLNDSATAATKRSAWNGSARPPFASAFRRRSHLQADSQSSGNGLTLFPKPA